MDTDEAPSAAAPASETDVNMQDTKNAANAENDAQEGDLPAQMETDAKVRTNCSRCSRRSYAHKQN